MTGGKRLARGAAPAPRTLFPLPPLSFPFRVSMAKAKAKTILVKLLSAAKTGYFYTAKKNTRNITKKLAFRKYDPVVRQHVLFQEAKIKR